MLYNVYFTTRQIVTSYDATGKKIGEVENAIPHSLTALPLSTALQYKDLGNFRIERYVAEQKSWSGRNKSKHHRFEPTTRGMKKGETLRGAGTSTKHRTSIAEAAATGDLAAAINGK